MPSTQVDIPKIVVDVVTIVGGILLAFAIEAWWEGSRERRAADELLRGIEAELSETLIAVEHDVEWLSASGRVLEAWPEVPSVRSAEIAQLLFVQTAEPELERIRGALISDRLSSVDPSIQDMVARLAAFWADLAEEEEVYFSSQMALLDYLKGVQRLDTFSRVCPDRDECRVLLVELGDDPGFREALAYKRLALAFYLDELEEMAELMVELREGLGTGTS